MTSQQLRKYGDDFIIFLRVLNQQQKDSNKIYSLYEPDVCCITKGKEVMKYTFDNKASIAKNIKSGIIVGALSFKENLYRADNMGPQLQQIERLTDKYPETAITDRGYRVMKRLLERWNPNTVQTKKESYQLRKTEYSQVLQSQRNRDWAGYWSYQTRSQNDQKLFQWYPRWCN